MIIADRMMFGGRHLTNFASVFNTSRATNYFVPRTTFFVTITDFVRSTFRISAESAQTSATTGPYVTFYDTGINTVGGNPTDTRQTTKSTSGITTFFTDHDTIVNFNTNAQSSHVTSADESYNSTVDTTFATSVNTFRETSW